MGGDAATSESVPARRVAGSRGDRRGRCRGDILSNCSYSRAGSRGRNGGGVFDGVPEQLITVVSCGLCTIINWLFGMTVFVFVFGVFLNSLIGEMEGKEREREEN